MLERLMGKTINVVYVNILQKILNIWKCTSKTCEVYKCDPKFKTLAEMKTHIENTHGDLSDEWGKVEHIKQSRGNKYEFSITPHKYSEIFSETGLKKKSI